MRRRAGWYKRLQDFLAEQRTGRFEYGKFDCCSFVAGATAAMTGEDVYSPFRGLYGDPESAQTLLESRGGLMKVMRDTYGPPKRTGDMGEIAALRFNREVVLGLVMGNGVICATAKGLVRLSKSRARVFWRVG